MKIDPKSIGVGQYQHDVSQTQLARKLDAVVEDCVNAVGVDLNTASVPLLTRVAGLTRMMAQNIVAWRDENGQFQNRQQLLRSAVWGRKPLNSAPASCVSTTATTRWMPPPCTRKPIRWSSAFWPPPNRR
ncbi:transcription accessory protein [Klebsiella variicola]|uniref:Transcription accessory protein n=1 Tax=Klebsiella variicola TaxID=244366 RepID=A0A7H4M8X6_KLEVA|nr:transcription accessory protein [Klebsiella variicola]